MVFTEDKDLKSQKNYMETIDAFKSRCHVFHPKMGYDTDKDNTREKLKSTKFGSISYSGRISV